MRKLWIGLGLVGATAALALGGAWLFRERLAQAAWPALVIVAVAVIPTVLLSGKVAASRPGEGR